MAMSAFAVTSPSSHGYALSALHARHSQRLHMKRICSQVRALAQTQLQYKKLGDSDLLISEVTLGTVCTKLETSILLTVKYNFCISRLILFFFRWLLESKTQKRKLMICSLILSIKALISLTPQKLSVHSTFLLLLAIYLVFWSLVIDIPFCFSTSIFPFDL